MNSAVMVIMAKYPQPGTTKTRLCPPLSFEQAAKLYEAMLRDTIALVSTRAGIDLAVAITPNNARQYFSSITPPAAHLLPVSGADIGECLGAAFDQLFDLGYSKVMALNADGPSLPAETLDQAAALLDAHDLVLGPGEDGGYYLVGLQSRQPDLFKGISWSTDQVLSQTTHKALRLGLNFALLVPWFDVDYYEDLVRLSRQLAVLPGDRLEYTRKMIATLQL